MDKRSNADNRNLCMFSYSAGRRCRMLRHRDHPGLCPFHSREERQALESERIGTELAATLTGHFLTASDINHVLGKVFTALAQDRISIKKAKALAYLAQLMLASLRYAKQETKIRYEFDSWQRMLKNSVPLPDPPDPIDPWESLAEGDEPLGVGASAPTLEERRQRSHLSSAHPSAPSADACADSSPVKPNDNASHEGLN